MVVGCQPYAPAAFTPKNIPGTHFHYGLSRPQGHGLVGRKYVTEKSSDTTGNLSRGRPTSSLNHYATPDPRYFDNCVFELENRKTKDFGQNGRRPSAK